jgi:diaminopimelate epimerase
MGPMSYRIVSADPAGNITIFVLDPVESGEERARVVRALLADPSLGAEQVGFVTPPRKGPGPVAEAGDAAPAGYWRLEMMGGEFCGNAARSFGLYVAREMRLSGPATVTIGISGSKEPLPVRVDAEAGRAELRMPGPLAVEALEFGGRRLPVYVFEGITHLIFPTPGQDSVPGRELVCALRDAWRAAVGGPCPAAYPAGGHSGGLPEAFGVMFWDAGENFMRPAVYVEAAGSLVFESSCGSGTAALAAWLARDLRDGEGCYKVAQPGGIIEARVVKQDGAIRGISIGGTVRLGAARLAL